MRFVISSGRACPACPERATRVEGREVEWEKSIENVIARRPHSGRRGNLNFVIQYSLLDIRYSPGVISSEVFIFLVISSEVFIFLVISSEAEGAVETRSGGS